MPVCGNYLFFELPKKIVLNPKDGKGEDARRNHSACFGRVLQSFFLKNSGLGL